MSLRKKSPLLELLVFTVLYGWEGPLIIYLGGNEGDVLYILSGILITTLTWVVAGYDKIVRLFHRGPRKQREE